MWLWFLVYSVSNSVHMKQTHKYKDNMIGLTPLASLYNEFEEAKNNNNNKTYIKKEEARDTNKTSCHF